jgi:uncharacterized protein (DUF2225 family)
MSSNETNMSREETIQNLYDKTVNCPICGKESKNKAVKKSSFKVVNRDSDSMIHYTGVNPSFYEVIFCPECGYAALPQYFPNVTQKVIGAVLQNISSKWTKPTYPEIYTEEFAIKQLKLALHNSIIKDGPDSEKGLICLKLSWMYRLLGEVENERRFQEQTILCFEKAYLSEKFPAAGMDEYTMQYLIGELNLRLGNMEKALTSFSAVLVAVNAPAKLKEKVRDQKALIDHQA